MKKAYQSYRCDICRANKNKKGDEIPNGWIKDGKYYACKSCIKAIQKHEQLILLILSQKKD